MSIHAPIQPAAVATALRRLKLPAVRWSNQYQQWYARIGYSRSKSGKRQRAYSYLGKDLNQAVLAAAARKAEWRTLRRKGGAQAVWPLGAAAAPAPYMADYSAEEIEQATAEYHDEITENALEDGVVEAKVTLRIEQVRDLYLEYRKGKIGIGGEHGVNDKTYSNESRNLKGALAVIDQRLTVDVLDKETVERLVDDIMRRADAGSGGELTKRTANNYLRELRRMLDWAHGNRRIPYRHDDDATTQLARRFRNPNPIKIAEYNADQLKALLADSTDRQRLFVYLALNCGYTQVEIGSLRRDQITVYEGLPAIVRRRSKTEHQNDFEALHTLWPETNELLLKHLAPANRWGLALLSEKGTPLYRRKPHCDIISDTYLVLCRRSDVPLAFKQFRKIGSTAIQRLGGDEARRLYKAGTIDSGDKVYVREAWEKLTPHLQRWAERLRQDGVLVSGY